MQFNNTVKTGIETYTKHISNYHKHRINSSHKQKIKILMALSERLCIEFNFVVITKCNQQLKKFKRFNSGLFDG